MADIEPHSPPPPAGNVLHSEHPLASPGAITSLPESNAGPGLMPSAMGGPPPAVGPPAQAMDPWTSQQTDQVLYSDIGVNALLNRLKQSIASAKELAIFLRKRATMEEEHSAQLRRLSKTTFDGLRSKEMRQGSFGTQFEDVVRIHEKMSDNGTQFRLNSQQMSEDLDALAHEMERGRKLWKHEALQAEQRLQDAERALDKSKQKYDSLAVDYDHARTGEKVSGGKFSIRQKSAAQQEEDLQRRLGIADEDYQAKVHNAQLVRQEVEKQSRPQAVRAILQLVQECDSAVTLQLQKFASFNERLLLGNGLLISPLPEGDGQRKGIRDIISQIDNEKDFHSYVTSFSNQVPPPKDIKYEKHPALVAPPPPRMPIQAEPAAASRTSFHQRQSSGSGPMGSAGPPVLPQSNFDSMNDRPTQQPQPYQNDGYRGAPPPVQFSGPNHNQPPYPSGPGSMGAGGLSLNPINAGPGGPMSASPIGPGAMGAAALGAGAIGANAMDRPYSDRPFSGPNQQQQGYQPYQPPPQSGGAYGKPAQGPAPAHSSPLNPMASRQSGGSRGPSYSNSSPVFGVGLNQLFTRDQSPVPLLVFQCMLAVDLFGLDHEGIYRVSGNASQVAQLKAQFDHDMHSIDFRVPDSFFLDVNVPATLLKQFFRELPDPLLTRAKYGHFLEAAAIPDDTMRRDRLHAAINDLPDPNYATLRALTLHLHRIVQHHDQNRMSSNNIAVIFAPTLMGGQMGGSSHDAALQHRVIETILVNALQIFDED